MCFISVPSGHVFAQTLGAIMIGLFVQRLLFFENGGLMLGRLVPIL